MVPRSNVFACKLAAQKCTRMYIFGRGCPWFYVAASFSLEKLDVEQLYKDVQLLNRLFSKTMVQKYTAHLRCRIAKSVLHGEIISLAMNTSIDTCNS
ncbi:hypothetical protein HMPREF9195_01381 [Treponema medium ATCC 700293]|uniref:Uncharacterized protein n=1 Tax=Treponema medium ATCC 700293 TaxID=1125700 RepID=A0AA87NR90_TREMD|nr:hypothetical protein HMPREF9195_01381 [Treponema medium ATCC 700293]